MKYALQFSFFSLCLIFASASYAEKIKVVTEYLAPFQIKDEQGKLSGFSTDVVKALFAHTKDRPDIHVQPWARTYHSALSEPNVMIYSLAHTKQRDPLFHWVGKLKFERFYFWGLKSQFSEPFDNIEQLKPYLISASKNYNTNQFLKSHGFKNLFDVVRDEQSLKLLYKGRIDLILSNELVLTKLLEKLKLDKNKVQKLFELKDLSNDISIAFSLNTEPCLLERYRSAYQHLVKSGKFDQIRNKWSITDDSEL